MFFCSLADLLVFFCSLADLLVFFCSLADLLVFFCNLADLLVFFYSLADLLVSAACEGGEKGWRRALWPNLKLLNWPPSFPVIGQEAEAMAEGSDGRRVETTGVKRGGR